MQYPTRSDVEEMRLRGFDASVIAEQLALAERGEALAALVAAVAQAFKDVTLGAGVGLLQANGLDDNASEEQIALYKAQDETLDWRAIPLERLNRYSSTPTFLDAKGMRFHLPAFLIADMNGDYPFDLVSALTQPTLWEHQFSLLNAAQRAVARQYLQFMLDDDAQGFDADRIRHALASYWALSNP